ncbi:MAG: hypothetical protein R2911_26410 [Caldilineaceae bacterium]
MDAIFHDPKHSYTQQALLRSIPAGHGPAPVADTIRAWSPLPLITPSGCCLFHTCCDEFICRAAATKSCPR